MKRETRVNLIFLGVFLALSIPGGVLLFKKKLEPGAGRMSTPDFVKTRLPFMVPFDTPDDRVARYVPELTGKWIDGLVRQSAVSAGNLGNEVNAGAERAMLMNGHKAMISPDRIVQAAGLRREAGKIVVGLILWGEQDRPEAERYRISIVPAKALQSGALPSGALKSGAAPSATDTDARIASSRIIAARWIELPAEVSRELASAGYTKPPRRVVWMEVEFDQPGQTGGEMEIEVRFDAGTGAIRQSIVKLFT